VNSITLAPFQPAPQEARSPVVWIISRQEDLAWFIGSALAGYYAIALMWLGFPLLLIQVVWLFAIDGPHVLATITRTYFDRAERKKLGWLLWMIVPLLMVGPVMSMAGQAPLFFLLAFCWQQVHVVKQHVGFAMIYKSKNRERDAFDRTLDRYFLLASLVVPLGLFLLATHRQLDAFASPIRTGALTAYGVLGLLWLARQIQKLRSGAVMNWPKVALLAVTIPLQWLALGFATRFGPSGILQAAIPLGLFHGLQYHRLMWFHNRNRYTVPGALERNGLAARLVGSVGIYLAVAIGLNFVLGFYIPQILLPYQVIQASLWGISFTHYFLDARIWHVRNDRELAVALRMA